MHCFRSLLGVDELVGDIADLVNELGQLDNTYFIYTADHGGERRDATMAKGGSGNAEPHPVPRCRLSPWRV